MYFISYPFFTYICSGFFAKGFYAVLVILLKYRCKKWVKHGHVNYAEMEHVFLNTTYFLLWVEIVPIWI